MGGPLADGCEHSLEVGAVGADGEQRAGVSQRADRGERVVELVRDDADDLLPDDHFLRRQLAGQLLEEHQLVRLSIEDEAAPGEMVDLGLAADLHGEQRIAAAPESLP